MSGLDVPTLESERLRLQPLSVAHSLGMFELWSQPAVCEHAGTALDAAGRAIELPVRSREDSDRLLLYWLERARVGSGLRWAVTLGGPEAFVGAVGFNALGVVCEYAYHLVPRFWGHGFATEASGLALEWAFDRGASRVECFVESANAPSARLLERLAFRAHGDAEGTLIRYALERPGSSSE